MIIFTGFGFLVLVAVGFLILTDYYLVVTATGSDAYYVAHTWHYGVTLLIAAACCWFVGQYFHKRHAKVLIDPKTGKEVVLTESHTFFFVPIRWWAPVLGIIAIVCFVKEFLK